MRDTYTAVEPVTSAVITIGYDVYRENYVVSVTFKGHPAWDLTSTYRYCAAVDPDDDFEPASITLSGVIYLYYKLKHSNRLIYMDKQLKYTPGWKFWRRFRPSIQAQAFLDEQASNRKHKEK